MGVLLKAQGASDKAEKSRFILKTLENPTFARR